MCIHWQSANHAGAKDLESSLKVVPSCSKITMFECLKPHLDHLWLESHQGMFCQNFISVDIFKKITEHNSWIAKHLCVVCYMLFLRDCEDCCGWYHMGTLKMAVDGLTWIALPKLHLLKNVYAQVSIISCINEFEYYSFMAESSNEIKY